MADINPRSLFAGACNRQQQLQPKNPKPQTTNYKQQTTNHKQQTTTPYPTPLRLMAFSLILNKKYDQ
jgi:hypothetical protein